MQPSFVLFNTLWWHEIFSMFFQQKESFRSPLAVVFVQWIINSLLNHPFSSTIHSSSHWPPNDTFLLHYFKCPCKIHDPANSCLPFTEFSGCQGVHFLISWFITFTDCACLPLRNACTLPCGISASLDSDLPPRESRKFSTLANSSNHFNFLYSQRPNEWQMGLAVSWNLSVIMNG